MTDYLRKDDVTVGELVDINLYYQLQQFYFEEADLLDEGRYVDWLERFDDDLYYWAPTRTNRTRLLSPDLTKQPSMTRLRTPWPGAFAASTPVWPGRRIHLRAPATSSPT